MTPSQTPPGSVTGDPGTTVSGRPLVICHGAIGDTIMLTALLRDLHARWGAPCDLLTGPVPARLLFEQLDFVGEVRNIVSRATPYAFSPSQRELVRWLRARAPGPCYLLEKRRRPVAPWSDRTRFEWMLDKAGIDASQIVSDRACPRTDVEHAVEHFHRLAQLEPVRFAGKARPARALPPLLGVSDEELRECEQWLAGRDLAGRPLVLLQTRARRTKVRGGWPEERWCELARGVLERLEGAAVVLIGSPRESRQTAALASAMADPRVHDVAADLPLRRLLALFAHAHSCISLDTGPAHAAAAVGLPVVVLVGTSDPRRNRPIGRPGRVALVTAWPEDRYPATAREWFERHDLASISSAAALDVWERLTAAGGDGPQSPAFSELQRK